METFNVEEGKDCVFDALTIYSGPTTNDSVLEGPLCGATPQNSSLFVYVNDTIVDVFSTTCRHCLSKQVVNLLHVVLCQVK